MGTDARLDLIETVYDAASGGTPWPVVEAALKTASGARTSVLMAGDLGTGEVDLLWREGFDDAAVFAYRKHYRHRDLWTTRAAALLPRGGPPRVLTNGEMLVPDSELLRSEFYADFARPHGLRWLAGTVAPLGEAGAMAIAVHRGEDGTPFEAPEKRLLDDLMPHLRRALQLRHRLRGADAATGLAALEALPQAVAVVDSALRLVLANAAAELLLADPLRGLRVHGAADRTGARLALSPLLAADRQALARLVEATALRGGSGGAMRVRHEASLPATAVMVMPLPGRLAGRREARVPGRALLLLKPLHAPAPPSSALLCELFALTRTEADVARALAGGTSKAQIAQARGLQETTVRTQVRSILEKTGSPNLRALERTLAQLEGL
jgi:DNA-binding CsgD family transcriptional regulator/PAS domain-containing protein